MTPRGSDNMIIIPAIDLRDGKVVRLTQGDFTREKTYSDNPADIAEIWQEQGAELIHIVDLDGALAGKPRNIDAIRSIVSKIGIPVQVGGGLRSEDDIESMISIGVKRVIVGTKACTDPAFVRGLAEKFNEKIAVSIDTAGKGVVAAGWGLEVPKTATQLASEIIDLGVKTIIFTNTLNDGTLKGVDSAWVDEMLDAAKEAQVIIAGGVSNIDDVKKLKKLKKPNLYGLITGKALYEGTLKLKEAIGIASLRSQ